MIIRAFRIRLQGKLIRIKVFRKLMNNIFKMKKDKAFNKASSQNKKIKVN